jgi:hypothetical protein
LKGHVTGTDRDPKFYSASRCLPLVAESEMEGGGGVCFSDWREVVIASVKTQRGPYAEPTLDFDFLGPNAPAPIIMTFTFPKGHEPFYVLFFADADEVEWTPLGQITVHPRKPVNP